MKDKELNLTWEMDGKLQGLNPRLAEKQKLTQKKVDKIISLHKEKHALFLKMEAAKETETLKHLAQEVTKVELKLQKAWGFPQDENFHYWYNVPQCECPKMDNRENWGTPYKIITQKCPVHGSGK